MARCPELRHRRWTRASLAAPMHRRERAVGNHMEQGRRPAMALQHDQAWQPGPGLWSGASRLPQSARPQ